MCSIAKGAIVIEGSRWKYVVLAGSRKARECETL